ncbi:FMN-binding glutamate synthase family protein, partial [Streptomyces sp. NPDC001356]
MMRISAIAFIGALAVAFGVFASTVSPWWWPAALLCTALAGVGAYDLFQKRHSVLRNYPVLGHVRFMLESIRPELQQYFIERNYDGRPYDRDVRSLVYQRAKGLEAEQPF